MTGTDHRKISYPVSILEQTNFSIQQLGVDYAPFRDLLKAGEWEKADDEHRRLMCVLAGEEAEERLRRRRPSS